MNMEQAEKLWESQSTEQLSADRLQKIVGKFAKASLWQIRAALLFTIFCVVSGALNFYGSYFQNGDSLVVASLRAGMLLMVLPIQIHVWFALKRKLRERVESRLDHRSWLLEMIKDLRGELGRPAWGMLAFIAVMLLLVTLLKWIEYQQGADTLTEGVVIVGLTAIGMGLVLVGVWHHREMFLKPRLSYYEQLLTELDSDQKSEDA